MDIINFRVHGPFTMFTTPPDTFQNQTTFMATQNALHTAIRLNRLRPFIEHHIAARCTAFAGQLIFSTIRMQTSPLTNRKSQAMNTLRHRINQFD
ncbi:MAG: hypothetical protein IKX48_06240, partial [Victivallales bacterium]|nr:hypothetical protein [Victivallales bacterium]